MKLREAVSNYPAEQAKLAQQEFEARQRADLINVAESQRLQTLWDAERTRWQPELNRLKEEFTDNNDYIKELAEKASSYINPKLEELERRLTPHNKQVVINLAKLTADPTSRREPHLESIPFEIQYRLVPATPFEGSLYFLLLWGTQHERYTNWKKALETYERKNLSHIEGRMMFREDSLDTFGLLQIGTIQIPVQQWTRTPKIIHSALESAVRNPKVEKYDQPYLPSSSGPTSF